MTRPTDPFHNGPPAAPAVSGLIYLLCAEYDPCGEWDYETERPICGYPLAEGPCPDHGTALD